MFSVALIAAPPAVPAFAAGGGGDPPPSATPPPPDTKPAPGRAAKAKKKPQKQSGLDDPPLPRIPRGLCHDLSSGTITPPASSSSRRSATTIFANVANLIGYSYRKLGDYKLSQTWYERALKSDPNHVLTWQYYGLWQIEQGNRDPAQYHLGRIAAICGTTCEEYRSLAAALEKQPGTGLVY